MVRNDITYVSQPLKGYHHCEFCTSHPCVGPPCSRVPKPYPNYEAEGYHYKNVFETPESLNGVQIDVDAFQPRKQAKDLTAAGRLRTDDEIKNFSQKFIVDEVLARKYVEHVNVLETNKRKRAEKEANGSI